MVLLTKTILHYGLNLLIPMSKVDENLRNATKRNAVREQTFYFRENVAGTEIFCFHFPSIPCEKSPSEP
jgi:hypothetical protein